jgi:hypothetical protein
MAATKTKYREELSDAELAEFLLENPTVQDSAWKSRAGRSKRKKGEPRNEFIHRVLLNGLN